MLSMPAKEVPNFFPISHMQTLLLFDVTLSSLAYTILKESALKRPSSEFRKRSV